MSIFKREPALIIGFVGAVVTALSGRVDVLPAGVSAAVVALLTAVIVAWRTQPKTPAMFVGVLTAAVSLLTYYGTNVSDATVTNLTAILLAGLALVGVRPQVVPVEGGSEVPPGA